MDRHAKGAQQHGSIDHQIAMIEQELARVIDLPTTPPDLRERLVARLEALKARASSAAPVKGS